MYTKPYRYSIFVGVDFSVMKIWFWDLLSNLKKEDRNQNFVDLRHRDVAQSG